MTRTVQFPTDPDKVMLVGDWHSNTHRAEHMLEIAARNGVRVVIQLGDFGFWRPCLSTDDHLKRINTMCRRHGITLLWTDGNHECHPELLKLPVNSEGVRRVRSNILHLPRGFRWTWHGEVWMALGGAHSVDTFMRREGVSVWQEEHISDEDAARAVEGGHVDVMVTHDCPDGVAIPGLVEGAFPDYEIEKAENHRRVLGRVVDQVGPYMLFHGHYHVKYESRRYRPQGGDTYIIGLADDGSRYSDQFVVLDFEETVRDIT